MSYDRNDADRNYISIGQWIGLFILMLIPVVNLISFIVLAFAGENDSRKNYYKASFLFIAVIFLLVFAVAYSGHFPEFQKALENALRRK